MFDPEKVERVTDSCDGGAEEDYSEEWVHAEDFDEMKSWWEERGREIDDLYEKLGKIGEIVGLSE